MENSWRYGFILRYPSSKSEATGIIYEPWHYRYVGKATAKAVYESGLCLEEYFESER
jgi:D-alanyl-D-alanine carboxypeptidase